MLLRKWKLSAIKLFCSKVAFILLPLYPLSIGGTREDIKLHLPTSTMGLLLESAGVSPWLVGRFNNESISAIRWCLTVCEEQRYGQIYRGGRRSSRVWNHWRNAWREGRLHFSELLLQSCSLISLFIVRSFICWLKWRAYYVMVTEWSEVIPVFPVICVRCVLLLDWDLIPSKS